LVVYHLSLHLATSPSSPRFFAAVVTIRPLNLSFDFSDYSEPHQDETESATIALYLNSRTESPPLRRLRLPFSTSPSISGLEGQPDLSPFTRALHPRPPQPSLDLACLRARSCTVRQRKKPALSDGRMASAVWRSFLLFPFLVSRQFLANFKSFATTSRPTSPPPERLPQSQSLPSSSLASISRRRFPSTFLPLFSHARLISSSAPTPDLK
jgi:hypothetical protein